MVKIMKTCRGHYLKSHEQVVYMQEEGRSLIDCPLCEALRRLEQEEQEVLKARAEVVRLEGDVRRLKVTLGGVSP